jgi:hypothetical protein
MRRFVHQVFRVVLMSPERCQEISGNCLVIHFVSGA